MAKQTIPKDTGRAWMDILRSLVRGRFGGRLAGHPRRPRKPRAAMEVKGRTDVVRVLRGEGSVIRLIGSVLAEVAGEREVGCCHCGQDSVRTLSEPEALPVDSPKPLRLPPVHGGAHRDSKQVSKPTKCTT
jgi:hypothetical protein